MAAHGEGQKIGWADEAEEAFLGARRHIGGQGAEVGKECFKYHVATGEVPFRVQVEEKSPESECVGAEIGEEKAEAFLCNGQAIAEGVEAVSSRIR